MSFSLAESKRFISHSQFYKHFGRSDPPPQEMGRGRDWNVDLIPKFLMANGSVFTLFVHVNCFTFVADEGASYNLYYTCVYIYIYIYMYIYIHVLLHRNCCLYNVRHTSTFLSKVYEPSNCLTTQYTTFINVHIHEIRIQGSKLPVIVIGEHLPPHAPYKNNQTAETCIHVHVHT